MLRDFVGITDPSEVGDFPSSGFRIHALSIALLANRQRSIHKDFYEVLLAHHVSNVVSGCAIGAHRRANYCPAMADNLRCDESDPSNVNITIFLAESQTVREMSADHITIQ